MRGMIEMRADYSQTDRHSVSSRFRQHVVTKGVNGTGLLRSSGLEKKTTVHTVIIVRVSSIIMLTRGKEDHEVRTG